MSKCVLKNFMVVLAAVFVAGCASTNKDDGGVTARAYIADKARVDQSMDSGNYGYLAGTPQPVDRSDLKKTRKIYVLEFTKEVPQPPDPPAPAPVTGSSYVPTTRPPAPEPEWAKPVRLPRIDDVDSDRWSEKGEIDSSNPSFIDYTVEKNDTLQKISKKFYDSYSKWPLILDANKATLKDPNKIRPGMKLRIPVK